MSARSTTVALAALVAIAPVARAVDVHILSAVVKDQVIPDAEVILQKDGETSHTSHTGVDGHAKVEPFHAGDDGATTLIVKKPGYSNLVVKCPCDGLTYALSPHLASIDGLRIVLDWGEEPRDLDSHLAYRGSHVYFSSKTGPGANLDVDDTDGYGPETITIEKKQSGVKYLYAVHDFTNGDRTGTRFLSSTSRAKVFVYIGSSLVRTFRPPAGKTGNTWVVFGIGESGEFFDVNRFADLPTRDSVGTHLATLLGEAIASAPVTTNDRLAQADQENKAGERAYHAKRYDDAIALYLQAIDDNPEHGQAYSNLGLVYQKVGKHAEALWANRKAIALASGPNRDTIQASSHYNIARLFEEEGRWSDALESYQVAKALKQHPAYDQGIARMRTKLGK